MFVRVSVIFRAIASLSASRRIQRTVRHPSSLATISNNLFINYVAQIPQIPQIVLFILMTILRRLLCCKQRLILFGGILKVHFQKYLKKISTYHQYICEIGVTLISYAYYSLTNIIGREVNQQPNTFIEKP